MWPSASLATIITNLAPIALLRRKLTALVAPTLLTLSLARTLSLTL